MIREQVAQFTGQRFLGNFQNDEQEYQALMNSGLTFAKKFNLREGIALSAEQMAMLTSDIVWLEQQTITLADGSTTTALVPRVYAALKDGDLAPSGALLGGNTVSITTAGDLTNSGTIAGRKTVSITANNINNLLGQINGGNTTLAARQDINNIGGSISADNNLMLNAGRDINITSTTQSSSGSAGGYQFSQSGIDRMAGLYTKGPGTLLASAGNNINLTAAQVKSAGDVQIEAGNDLNLSTLQQTRSDNFNAGDPNNHFLSNSSKEVGSNITSSGNTKLAAGNTLTSTAAKVDAGGDLTVNANNIVLQAGQSKASSDSVMTNTSGDMISSTTTVTKESQASAKAQVNQLTGKNVTVTAEQDLVSVGSKFAANDSTNAIPSGNLTVEGKNSQTFYAAKDVNQSSKSVESSSSMLGGMINLGSSTTTDTSSKQVSIASALESTNAINVRVGNSATFEGADISAKTTTFTKTDPNKAGQVNLNGSVDTTETAHTEKSDTMGVYQSQSGSGSTTQSLNLTKINGAVNIDQNLAVAVQLPKTVTTSGDKANTAAVANATNATSQASVQAQIDELSKQPGLAYLSQLSSNAAKANPAQWSQVQLAHDNWSYSQSGLTPAGAALLSIAVAAYAPGLSSGLTSSITATAGASAAAAASAGFAALQARAAVAMVNNGGDIGKTLQQLGSEQSVKALLTTMATAGALSQLNETLGFNGQTGAGSSGNSGITTGQATNAFQQNLLKNVTNNVAGSAIDAAISGKAFDEKALSTALSNALITAGMAQGANSIGDAFTAADISNFTSKLAHAALGCAGGVAAGSSCNAGALGALVGEVSAEFINPNADPALKDKTLAFAKTMSAVVGVIAGGGGDNSAAVNAAATTGANAAENNWLGDHQKAAMTKEMKSATSTLDKLKVAGKYLAISGKQDILTTTDIGMGLAEAGWSDVKGLAGFLSDPVVGIQGIRKIITDPATRTAMGEQAFSALDAKLDSMNNALTTGGDDAALQLGKDLGSLAWQVGGVVTGAMGAAKGVTTLATAGIRIGAGTVDAMTAARAAKAVEDAQATAKQLNNFYRDGAPAELIQKTFNAAAISSTHNAVAPEVVLGRYIAGSADSYDAVAQARGATYFSMSDWNAVQAQLGQDQMWNINKAFLDQQIAQGKSFVFTVDPASVSSKSYTALEFNHLQSNGYAITGTKDGLFIATKK